MTMLLAGTSREDTGISDTQGNNSPSLLCSDDDESNNDNYTAMEMERKAEEIQRCLAGTAIGDANTDESVVDLWHLRTLSLSTGGLLNSTLRRRCWPKLLGLDEAILLNNSASSSPMMANSGNIRSLAASTLVIQSALAKISKTSSFGCLLWDIEGQIKSNRRAREAERAIALRSRLGGTAANVDDAADVASLASAAASVASTTSSFAAIHHKQTKGKNMTKQELSILTNILTAVFKHTAFDAKSVELSAISQLANLSALLLINLESPSLTSILMQSLAKEHLRVGNTAVDEVIDFTFWTLLDCADEKYGGLLRDVTGDTNGKAFVSSWVSSWFASALPTGLGRMDATTANHSNSLASIELEVASRFIDVFLCSHPHMPVYVSVALVMHPANRKIVAEADQPTDILVNLPSIMLASILGITDELFFDRSGGENIIIADKRKAELMDVVEDVVSGAIDMMRAIPPSKLIDDTTTPLPKYMLKSSAPTDFALIQQAKESRINALDPLLASLSPMSEASTPTASPTNGDANSSKFKFSDEVQDSNTIIVPADDKYALAVAAVGLAKPARPNVESIKTWSAYLAVYVLGLAVAVAFDRSIVNVMNGADRVDGNEIVSVPVPAVIMKTSVPTTTSNALIPASEVYDGVPKPFSAVVVSSLSFQSVEQAFVHGASYIGASVGPVFGPVFAEEGSIDLDDDVIGANVTHRLYAFENLIAGALPTTYYF